MKNIEKRLIAYYAASTESAPVAISKHKAPVNEANVRRPWSKAVKTALAAILIMAILVAMPHFIKNGNINGIGVLIDDTKTEESEVETTENSAEKDDKGKESEESENNESRLIPPEGVKIVYAPDATKVIGGGSGIIEAFDYCNHSLRVKGLGENYLKTNGLDSMYYVVIKPYSSEHKRLYTESCDNRPAHSFEEHVACFSKRIEKDLSILEEHGITDLELQWINFPHTDKDFDGCSVYAYAFVGYVKGEALLNFRESMDKYFWPYYYDNVKIPTDKAIGATIYLMPEGYNAQEYMFGTAYVLSREGHWMEVGCYFEYYEEDKYYSRSDYERDFYKEQSS